jgi:DNA-binding XRE family transcriptional regulator
MTPAEKLASKRRPRKSRGNVNPVRKRVWNCSLRAVRQSLSLAIHEVAKATGMSVAGLSEIERGTDPMLSSATKLAAFYGKTVDELWRPMK